MGKLSKKSGKVEEESYLNPFGGSRASKSLMAASRPSSCLSPCLPWPWGWGAADGVCSPFCARFSSFLPE